MMPYFSERSRERLMSCHPDLQAVFAEVIKHRDCTILEGHRSDERQEELYELGRSKARAGQSKHNARPSNAVDVMPYPIDWNDHERTREFAGFVFGVASQMGVKLKWGGHWRSFKDSPHWEVG